ncbi:hypothetical protein [Streptomyces sp. NPDC005969]|uniref:hypothetical protein n=1 Tax=Streptomyces sp. NPDC005969 TaxID=3156722 RepID=UPI0033E2FAFC
MSPAWSRAHASLNSPDRHSTCRVARGLREDTGEQLTGRQLAQRVGRLSSLVVGIGRATTAAHWDKGRH